MKFDFYKCGTCREHFAVENGRPPQSCPVCNEDRKLVLETAGKAVKL
jgi:rubrerythrin